MGFVLAKEKPGTPGGHVYLTDVTLVETASGGVEADAKVSFFATEAFVFPDAIEAERWADLLLPERFTPAELPEAGPEPNGTGAQIYICGVDARAQRRETEDRRNLRALIAPFIEAEAAAGVSPQAIELDLKQAGVEVTDWDRAFIRRTTADRPRSRSCRDHSGLRAEAGD